MSNLAIVAGHISAVRAETIPLGDGKYLTTYIAEVTSSCGTFDIPVLEPTGLFNANVEITVRVVP